MIAESQNVGFTKYSFKEYTQKGLIWVWTIISFKRTIRIWSHCRSNELRLDTILKYFCSRVLLVPHWWNSTIDVHDLVIFSFLWTMMYLDGTISPVWYPGYARVEIFLFNLTLYYVAPAIGAESIQGQERYDRSKSKCRIYQIFLQGIHSKRFDLSLNDHIF